MILETKDRGINYGCNKNLHTKIKPGQLKRLGFFYAQNKKESKMKFLIIGFAIKFIAELVNQKQAKEEKVDNQILHPAEFLMRIEY
jgi:hypothetical protein